MTGNAKDLGRITWGLIGAAVLLQVVIFAVALNTAAESRVKVDAINRFIYCTLDRSEKTLPTIDYYVRHPGELEEQLMLVREQKADFTPPPEPCSP